MGRSRVHLLIMYHLEPQLCGEDAHVSECEEELAWARAFVKKVEADFLVPTLDHLDKLNQLPLQAYIETINTRPSIGAKETWLDHYCLTCARQCSLSVRMSADSLDFDMPSRRWIAKRSPILSSPLSQQT